MGTRMGRGRVPRRPGTWIFVLLGSLAAGPSIGVDAWTCTAGTGTGYLYDAGQERWETQVFPVPDQVFRIRQGPGGWELLQGRAGGVRHACTGDPNAGPLTCGPDEGFRFDPATGTFVSHLAIRGPQVPGALLAATVMGRCTAG